MIDARIALVRDATGKVVGFRDERFGPPTEYSFADPLWTPYLTCRWCKRPLNDVQVKWALTQLAPVACGTTCMTSEMLCCDKATPLQCVCALSWTCPVHGTRHVGTHD